jgi:hypothetical protein
MKKQFAIAKITDPTLVKNKAASMGQNKIENGAIFCSIPELGLVKATDLIYCRYGLSIPYLRVQPEQPLWVEPTIGTDSRWVYTGFADCGDTVTPDAEMQMMIKLANQVIYASTSDTLHLSVEDADQPFVNGTPLEEWCKAVDASIKKLLDWAMTGIPPGGGPVDVGGIAPLVPAPTDYTEFPSDDVLSTKIFGE